MKDSNTPESKPKKKPGRKTTEVEQEERIAFAADCLFTHRHKPEQIKALKDKYDVTWRQAERYLADARERVRAASRVSDEENLAEQVGFLRHVMLDGKEATKNRLQAQKQLARATGVGLVSVRKTEIAGRVEQVVQALRQAADEARTWTPPTLTVVQPIEADDGAADNKRTEVS